MTRRRTAKVASNPIAIALDREIRMSGRDAKEISLSAGLSESAARDILSGRVKKPQYRTLDALAGTLGIPISRIIGQPAGVNDQGVNPIPILQTTPDRGGREMPPHAFTSDVLSSTLVSHGFALYVEDQDNEPRLHQGDVAILHPTQPVRPRDMAAISQKEGPVIFRQVTGTGDPLETFQIGDQTRQPIARKLISAIYRVCAIIPT